MSENAKTFDNTDKSGVSSAITMSSFSYGIGAKDKSEISKINSDQRNHHILRLSDRLQNRAVPAKHHYHFRLFAGIALRQSERRGQSREALAHRIGAGLVPVHVEYYLSHGE